MSQTLNNVGDYNHYFTKMKEAKSFQLIINYNRKINLLKNTHCVYLTYRARDEVYR